ncbi:hypothetical protein M9Y10_030069 [Tritrichomonas musculus]|uniref:Uncharacterized protein n=1 Tax=Tritrichomonas musculus TaxID=1915356 RepID=A0ABR2KPZ4_9EUKA
MFILLTALSVFWNADKFKQFELAQIPKLISLFPIDEIQENLNDLMNDGVNRTVFIRFFGHFPILSIVYNKFIDTITNQDFTIHIKLLKKVSPYLNVNQDLYSISPEIKELLLQNKKQFDELKEMIAELGPHLCTSFNLDFNVISRLYNYIFINEDNDGVVIGKILEILDLPTDFVSELSKILSFFDDQKPIIRLFDGLNVRGQYLKFIEKVRLLRIPNNDERFFSFIRVIDAFSSFVDLINDIHHNFFVKNENEVVKPLMIEYLINPINIFDVSIFDRAIELNTSLNIIQSYSSSCTISNSSDIQHVECKLFQAIRRFLIRIVCNNDNEDDDTCEEEVYERVLNIVQDFTNPKVNLTNLLIVKYQIPENYVKFVFGLFENLTSKNKTYLDLLQGLTLIVPDDKIVSVFHYHEVKFHTFVTNVTNLVNFIININDTSNIRLAFEYLNRTEQWDHLRHFVTEISQNKTLCEIKKLAEKECSDLFNSIIGNATKFISNQSFINSIPHEKLRLVINGTIPFLKSIRSSVSNFVSGLYNLTAIRKGEVNFVDFTTFIESIGNLIDKIVSVIDGIVPIFYKRLPFIGDRYRSIVWKSRKVSKILQNNGQTVSIFYIIFGRLGIISEMLSSFASAYVDENTTIATMTRLIKPTTFLNVYETLQKISQLTDLQIKNLAETITFDTKAKSSLHLLGHEHDHEHHRPVSFNDIFPIKTIAENAQLLADEMKENVLDFQSVALALGIKKDELKQKIISFIRSILAIPAKTIREIAIESGNDEDDVDEYFEKICGFSKNMTMGKQINLKSKVIQKSKKNKKILTTPVIIGIAIAAFVVVSIIIAVTIYLVNKKKKQVDPNHDFISQQMLVDN